LLFVVAVYWRDTISEIESDHIRSQPERHGTPENRVFQEWENMKECWGTISSGILVHP
jgi:hypothetical protein